MQRVRHLFGGLLVLSLSAALVSGPVVSAHFRPYLRAYGNDVRAGGGYEGSCPAAPSNETIRGYGRYVDPVSTNWNHSTYVGSGSELGAFAHGRIEGFLSGSATTAARDKLTELGFANTTAAWENATNQFFGGGYQGVHCNDAFPIDPLTDPATVPSGWVGWSRETGTVFGDPADLAAYGPNPDQVLCDYMDPGDSRIPDGARILIRSNGFHFGRGCSTPKDAPSNRGGTSTVGGGAGNGKNITIVIGPDTGASFNADAGSVVLLSDIRYGDDASGWATIDDIPILRVYANHEIRFDYSVTQAAGLYFANGSGTGSVKTCTSSSDTITTLPPGLVGSGASFFEDDLVQLCDQKLTIFGGLVGREGLFYRIQGSSEGATAANVGEGYTSGNIAEAIVFSPEVYLALLAGPGGPSVTAGEVDAIRSLPPAF